MKSEKKPQNILPGKNINLIFSLSFLSTLLILPLAALALSIHDISVHKFIEILISKRSMDAFRLSFFMSLAASLIALFLGIIIAWTLVRYSFPGKNLFDSIVDLPFAMPTAVSGIALASIYAQEGWIGKLFKPFGIEISYAPSGILIALIFIGLPFVVRSIQPAIVSLNKSMEEAAASLGASRPVVLRKIVVPQLFTSIMTGFTMSFSRCLGEYGSVIFIAGNIPYESEILPLLIVVKLEQFDYQSATVLALGMLSASFVCLVALGSIGEFLRRRYG